MTAPRTPARVLRSNPLGVVLRTLIDGLAAVTPGDSTPSYGTVVSKT